MAPPRIHGRTVEMVALADLKPYEKNARQHPEDQLKALEAIIQDSGFTAPLIIDPQNGIIAGHGRALVAKRLGMAHVPCVRVKGLSAAQIKALRLSDNQTGLRSTWDPVALLGELTGLQAVGFDLNLTAFAPLQLGEIGVPGFATAERLEAAEETPEPPKVPVVRAGEIWLLGDHRLVIGDSTDKATVERLLAGKKCDCAFTSPPYGVGIEYGTYKDTIANLRALIPALATTLSNVLAPGAFAVINFADIISGSVAVASKVPCEYPMALEYWPAFRSAGFELWSRRIWMKPHARVNAPWTSMSNRAASDWEHLWTWKTPGKPLVGRNTCSPLGVWDTSKEHGVDVGKRIHGAGMAVGVAIRGITAHTKPNAAVFEPFCGTGTTLIAAEMEMRRCFAAELSPVYAQVIIERWQNFTNKTAEREDGATLEDLKNGRVARKVSRAKRLTKREARGKSI